MSTRLIYGRAAMGMAAVLVLSACTGLTDRAEDDEEPDDVIAQDEAAEEPDAEDVSVAETIHQHVQDLWIYERVAKVGSDGEVVDLTEAIVDGLAGPADEEIALLDDVTFHVYEALAPTMTAPDGALREDLELVAGLVEYEGDRALSLLATPEPDAQASVRFGDEASVDLSFLGDLLAPGDPMVLDYAFLQAYPTAEGAGEEGLTGLDLLAARMADERVIYFGQEVDGEPEVLLYHDQLGQATEGSIRGEWRAKARPMRDGMNRGVICLGGLMCVAGFFVDFIEGAWHSYRQALCNGGLLATAETGEGGGAGGCPPGDPPPDYPDPDPDPPVCHGCSTGEPHMVTFDDFYLSMQAAGEFLVMRTDEIEVQKRTQAWQDSTTIAVNTAVAVGYDEHRVTVDIEADAGEVIRLDGDPVGFDDLRAEPHTLGDASVTLVGDTLRVEYGEYVISVANLEGRGFIDLYVDLGDDRPSSKGLFGDASGDRADGFTTREGQVLERPLSRSDRYDVFLASWRISNEESLFDYPPGTDTEHYTDLSIPTEEVTVDDLDDAVRAMAEAVCTAAGIVEERAFTICVFDYGLTGEMDFVRSAASVEVADLIREGRLDPQAPVGGVVAPSDVATSSITGEAVEDPYEASADQILWNFTTEDLTPEAVPDFVEATEIRDPHRMPRLQVTGQYDYEANPVLQSGAPRHAETAAGAIEADAYIEFAVTPTAGAVQLTQVQVSAAMGAPDTDPRGFDLRSSADGFATPLMATDLEVSRPDMERFTVDVSDLTIGDTTTFRLYVYTAGGARTVEFGDIALTLDR